MISKIYIFHKKILVKCLRINVETIGYISQKPNNPTLNTIFPPLFILKQIRFSFILLNWNSFMNSNLKRHKNNIWFIILKKVLVYDDLSHNRLIGHMSKIVVPVLCIFVLKVNYIPTLNEKRMFIFSSFMLLFYTFSSVYVHI